MFKNKIAIPHYGLTLFIFIAFSLAFGGAYFLIDDTTNPKIGALLGGFSSAFLVASIQLFINISDTLKLSKYIETGFREILPGRKDTDYYGKLINESQKYIVLIGTTASRFMDDFADKDASSTELPKLITALNRGVKTRLLLPKIEWLNSTQSADFVNRTLPAYLALQEKHPDAIEMRYYDHIPSQSLVATEKTSIVGPMLPPRASKNTQSIVLDSSSEYAKQYIEYFDVEWENASIEHE